MGWPSGCRGTRQQGARFAKWREVYAITDRNPTPLGIAANAEVLARYAAICQQEGIVPIVEPEVLIDGDAQHRAFLRGQRGGAARRLPRARAPQGDPRGHRAEAEHGAARQQARLRRRVPSRSRRRRLNVLRRTVPAAVPTINFLSGGQSPEDATANLNAMNAMSSRAPWTLSFSYARALQDPAMRAWGGREENVKPRRTRSCGGCG